MVWYVIPCALYLLIIYYSNGSFLQHSCYFSNNLLKVVNVNQNVNGQASHPGFDKTPCVASPSTHGSV